MVQDITWKTGLFFVSTAPSPTVDTDGAEATKMTSRLLYDLEVIKNYRTALSLIMHISPGIPEVLPVITTERTMNQVHAAALHPVPLPHPDPKVKRATLRHTVQKIISTQPQAPRNTVRDDLHHAPTLDPWPDHALALGPGPGPGLGESLEVTDCFLNSKHSLLFICLWWCFC